MAWRRVDGYGPRHAKLFLIGSAPGWQEARTGRPFVGKTGDELDALLARFNLPPRREWFLTNLYREFVDKDYEYTTVDYDRDLPFLLDELQDVQPEIVVTLGREAMQLFLGDVNLEAVWGLPWLVDQPHQCILHPAYHIAAGFRNPELSAYVTAGWQAFADFYHHRNIEPRRMGDDPYPDTYYRALTGDEVCHVLRDL